MNLLNRTRRSPKHNSVCFHVFNFEELSYRDPEVITRLEVTLASAGAIPAKIDFPSQMCCVTIVNESLTIGSVQSILEKIGYRVALINDKDGGSHESA